MDFVNFDLAVKSVDSVELWENNDTFEIDEKSMWERSLRRTESPQLKLMALMINSQLSVTRSSWFLMAPGAAFPPCDFDFDSFSSA